jgi:hypothetical protein
VAAWGRREAPTKDGGVVALGIGFGGRRAEPVPALDDDPPHEREAVLAHRETRSRTTALGLGRRNPPFVIAPTGAIARRAG